ncbi:MAG: anhydro-N-acetylmuramic acid kinase [Thermomicrobiales bacterium]|jgi:anhydro-N-acetylmuramic acid kinase|nr:anhydro-N-acetylmuramic acid kinase [Thermomicrobiales bacterium]
MMMSESRTASVGTGDGRLCVGLISGTSADGIDAALVRIAGAGDGAHLQLVAFVSTPYPTEVRDELLALYAEDAPHAVARLCSLNALLGELFAEAALDVCRRAGVPPTDLHVIGSHGQTVWHEPGPDPAWPLSRTSTLQIGEPSVIAERTGAPVVADFRVADVAAGGQAAPLVPYFDWVVLRHPTRNRAVQNIGGIGNVTSLPAGCDLDAVRAFDTGPGNMVLDGLVTLLTGGTATFDRDGALAAAGTADPTLLDTLLRDPYLDAPPPKTTGRERYGLAFARRLLHDAGLREDLLAPDSEATPEERQRARDLLATATAFTARSIADAYRRWLPQPDDVLVGGGGSRNPTLMRLLRDELAPVPVAPIDTLGVDGRAKEAMAFALIAHDALAGLPTNVPGATGARRAVTLGKLVPPSPRR